MNQITEHQILSQDTIIAIAVSSSVSLFILIIGFTCGYTCRKYKKGKVQEEANTQNLSSSPTILYEEVKQPKNVQLNQNMAYGPISMVTAKF